MSSKDRADWLAELYYEHCEQDCGQCSATVPNCAVGDLIDFLLRHAGLSYAGALVRAGVLS